MTDLLDLAVQAHGGMKRWRQLSSIRIAASITGATWFAKGQGDALKDVVLTIDTTTERVRIDFPGRNRRAIFTPARVVIESEDGTLSPRATIRRRPSSDIGGRRRGTTSTSSISPARRSGPI